MATKKKDDAQTAGSEQEQQDPANQQDPNQTLPPSGGAGSDDDHDQTDKEPNVQLIARDKNGKVDITKALTTVRRASGNLTLPARELQAEPFYLKPEKAEILFAEYRFLYKPFVAAKNAN